MMEVLIPQQETTIFSKKLFLRLLVLNLFHANFFQLRSQ